MSPRTSKNSRFGAISLFVREGNEIAHQSYPPGSKLQHVDIAKRHKIGKPIDNPPAQRLVEDSGLLAYDAETDTLVIYGDALTCEMKGDRVKTRIETTELLKEITGRNVERR